MVHALCGMSTALGVVDMGIEQFMEDNRENLKRKLVVVRLNGSYYLYLLIIIYLCFRIGADD